jgi:hypothetical protein
MSFVHVETLEEIAREQISEDMGTVGLTIRDGKLLMFSTEYPDEGSVEVLAAQVTSADAAAPEIEEDATGVRLIAIERERQKAKWSDEHDDEHTSGDIAVNAAILAVKGTDAVVDDELERDGWGLVEKHAGDYVRRLTIAGALLAAEIDRELRRLEKTS